MPVPPLHHRVLHARPDRVALGMAERDRNCQVVDDVQDRHDHDEGHVVPVGDVDVRLPAARQRSDVEDEIGDPDDDEPEVGIPFRLGIFLRLRHTHEIAGHCQDAEEVVAEQHEPRTELICQPGARGPLNNMERRCNQGVAAEPENDPGCMSGSDPSEARPGRVEIEARPSKLRRRPDADEHAEDRPEQCEPDADLDGIVVVARDARRVRGRPKRAGHDEVQQCKAIKEDNRSVYSERVEPAGRRHGNTDNSQDEQYCRGQVPFTPRQLSHEVAPSS
ncbi:hypothetical protein ACVII0_001287 [Sinorhizobium meliloti]